MKRPKEVKEALTNLACAMKIVNCFDNSIDTVEQYIKTLELIVDTAYKRLEELDEIV